jgi:hypothetical protein
VAAVVACLAGGLPGLAAPAAGAAAAPGVTAHAAGNPFCRGLGKHYQASSGAYVFCRREQPHRSSGVPGHPPAGKPVPGAPGNVDAASSAEDVSPGGLRGYGQSETSIAASGQYVVEAWNDATALTSGCPSPKAQVTAFGFSSNGGKTFTDLKGLPDAQCFQSFSDPGKGDIYQGDPSVVAYRAGGHTYFYISSLYDNYFREGQSFVALAACQVTGSGSWASLHCGQPVIAGASTQCQTSGRGGSRRFCSFLDKDYLTIDPAHGRLYVAFTEFTLGNTSQIVASPCDLGTPAGRAGLAGGTPAAPVCEHGTPLHKAGKNKLAGKPYLIVQPGDPAGCEYEGAYPAADTASGSLYVGYEFNWSTDTPFNLDPPCFNKRAQNIVAGVPWRCLVLRAVSPCAGPAARASVPITSISGALLPGYVPSSLANDFPRLAVSDPAHAVSMVWNDTRYHPYGDILLQSFALGSLHPVQARPVILDTPHHGGLAFLPAVRTATADGLLDVSWYSRNSLTTSDTTLNAALGVSPCTTSTPHANIAITNMSSDWGHQTFDVAPDFGDYTDSALNATGSKPYVGHTLYIAWTDGRTGVPQPYEAHLPAAVRATHHQVAASGSPFCQGLGRKFGASSAAYAYCRGARPHGPAGPHAHDPAAGNPVPGAPGNADAASPAEDVSPNGERGYGQSDTSIAASGRYVVEAWNDTTGRFSGCPSPKAQITGLGFSSDGGKTFTDLEGPPDARCAKDIYWGDPSVAAYRAGGHTYFYISSLFDPPFELVGPKSFVALAACQVTGSGSWASLHCGQPVIAGASTQCLTTPGFPPLCSFLDKPFLTIDPAHRRLYAAYTEFRLFDRPVGALTDQGAIEVSACDLGTAAGHAGPAGGTAAAPVCEHGTPLHKAGGNKLAGKPYLTVQQPDDRRHCEYEGAYPAADTASGSLYVGYEYNWSTSFFGPTQCYNTPIQNMITKVPRRCLALRTVSPCAGPAARAAVPITSISAAFLPGYVPNGSGYQPNDFPRLAVSGPAHAVSMVWNDTRYHPYGDILLQSFTLGSLHPVQARPVVLDTPHHGGLAFLPAVRTATADGLLDVSWYSRNSLTTSDTTLNAALGVSPRATSTPHTNVAIANVASNWDHQSYDFPPDFGDYTDSALTATGSKPYVGHTLYIAWTDGRTGVPQPFEAHLPAGR